MPATGPTTRRLSARHIREACEASLRRLQTDHIDLYQMHHVDRDTPWEEIWQAMDLLVAQGKVIYVGSSNFAGWHIVAGQRGGPSGAARFGLVSEQSLYNLNARTVELEVLPACQAYGLGIIPWSPLGGGLLGGVARRGHRGPAGQRAGCRRRIDGSGRQLEAWEKLCAELGERPADVALAWLLANPVGDGTDHRAAHHGAVRRQPARARDRSSTPRCSAKLDEIFPGPGAAPEAYAW